VEYKAGLDLAIAKRWLSLHESGTHVKVHRGRNNRIDEATDPELPEDFEVCKRRKVRGYA
jgi:hypothetical protein